MMGDDRSGPTSSTATRYTSTRTGCGRTISKAFAADLPGAAEFDSLRRFTGSASPSCGRSRVRERNSWGVDEDKFDLIKAFDGFGDATVYWCTKLARGEDVETAAGKCPALCYEANDLAQVGRRVWRRLALLLRATGRRPVGA